MAHMQSRISIELSTVCKDSTRQIAENNLPGRRAEAEKVDALALFGDVIGVGHQGWTDVPRLFQYAAEVAVGG